MQYNPTLMVKEDTLTSTKQDDESVGISNTFSFEEALRDVINALHKKPSDFERVKVAAEIGGFANVQQISVRVGRESLS